MSENIDKATVDGFGDEWERFDQSELSEDEHESLFQTYFGLFPWSSLPSKSVGFDLGCGSGRWAAKVAPKVGKLHCIDPSSALNVAKRNLAKFNNCEFHSSDVETIPLLDNSMDFGYSLGVLHHIPDTKRAMSKCVAKLSMGAPFLVYLYYSFENRPTWFRLIWRCSEIGRAFVSQLPYRLRYFVSQIIALTVYWPLARLARIAELSGANVSNFPLASYRNCSFYTMRTDALDRFGTRLEQRFSKKEIIEMMEAAGLRRISFSESEPHWVALGYRDELPGGRR